MPIQLDNLSFFIIPPLLSLFIQLALIAIVLVKGGWKEVNLLLVLVSFWWTLLSPVFIAHHIITDENLLLEIERKVHILYVFVTPVTIHFIHRAYGLMRLPLTGVLVAVSCVFAYFTPTEYYFNGFYRFDWGYIARGGVALDMLGLYALGGTLYVLVLSYQQLMREQNPLRKLKIKYISFSFLVVAVMSLLNIPAIKGYDVYPVGNLIFIPLSILIYGILRHRLIEARFIIKVTIPRIVFSLLILIPNFALLFVLKPYLSGIDPILLCVMFLTWYLANYYYFQLVQPQIDRLFEIRKRELQREKIEEKREKYQISHINGVDLEEVGRKLTGLMEEERVFCDEDLTLSRLAEMVDLTSHQLSEYLNRHLNRNFYHYLNHYRINEAKSLLKEHERSVLDIALGVGFNSKSAFYRAFKDETGMTPKRFRELDQEWKGIKPGSKT